MSHANTGKTTVLPIGLCHNQDMCMEAESYHSHSEDETRAIGKAFAEKLNPGDIITLIGELGAGKTEFVRGVCEYFSVHDIVSSPTFTIMNQYIGSTPQSDEVAIYHIDLYRIQDSKELNEIGFAECMDDGRVIKFVEWPEKAGDSMPAIHWTVSIKPLANHEDDRMIHIDRVGE